MHGFLCFSDGSSSYGPTRGGGGRGEAPGRSEEPVDERLKGIEPKIVELITNEVRVTCLFLCLHIHVR